MNHRRRNKCLASLNLLMAYLSTERPTARRVGGSAATSHDRTSPYQAARAKLAMRAVTSRRDNGHSLDGARQRVNGGEGMWTDYIRAVTRPQLGTFEPHPR